MSRSLKSWVRRGSTKTTTDALYCDVMLRSTAPVTSSPINAVTAMILTCRRNTRSAAGSSSTSLRAGIGQAWAGSATSWLRPVGAWSILRCNIDPHHVLVEAVPRHVRAAIDEIVVDTEAREAVREVVDAAREF